MLWWFFVSQAAHALPVADDPETGGPGPAGGPGPTGGPEADEADGPGPSGPAVSAMGIHARPCGA